MIEDVGVLVNDHYSGTDVSTDDSNNPWRDCFASFASRNLGGVGDGVLHSGVSQCIGGDDHVGGECVHVVPHSDDHSVEVGALER